MKATWIKEAYKVFSGEAVAPEVGAGDVLLKPLYIGLCGSDLNAYMGLSPMVEYPVIPGHEISALVVEKGCDVQERISVGMCVTVKPYFNCGKCFACRAGKPNACRYNQTLGVQRDGAMCGLICVPQEHVFCAELKDEKTFSLVEPIAVGSHIATRCSVADEDVVLVLGCGAVGLGAIAACSYIGASVIAVDVNAEKLEIAKKFGAKHLVDSTQEDVLRLVREITDGDGVSVAIEAIGLPQTCRLAVDAIAYTGRIGFVGYAMQEIAFDTKLFVSKEVNLFGSRNALDEFDFVLEMMQSGHIDPLAMVSAVYPLAEVRQAFEDWGADKGAFTKILIDMNGEG